MRILFSSIKNYFFFSECFKAASIKPLNNGCGLSGRGPEETGGDPVQQHGCLRCRIRDGSGEGTLGGCHRIPGIRVRDVQGDHRLERVPCDRYPQA